MSVRKNRVYFIKPIGMDGPVKIGCSYSPDGRRKTLETWAPFALEIVAEIEGGFDLERRFHALFAETHQRREWFGWSRRLATVIAAINDGSFDVAALPAPMKLANAVPGCKRGSKWTDEQKQRARRANALRRAEKASGLRLLWPRTEEQILAFIASPSRETGGLTHEEYATQSALDHAHRLREQAATYRKIAAEITERAALISAPTPDPTSAKAAA